MRAMKCGRSGGLRVEAGMSSKRTGLRRNGVEEVVYLYGTGGSVL